VVEHIGLMESFSISSDIGGPRSALINGKHKLHQLFALSAAGFGYHRGITSGRIMLDDLTAEDIGQLEFCV
jgi:hypothetical protein